MPKVWITVMGFRCERCSHEWQPRDIESEPRTCPACKSPYWDIPRGMLTRGRPLKPGRELTSAKGELKPKPLHTRRFKIVK